ncbi:MAG: N-acetylneuraminate synthase family protein, partial [Desulfobacterales bacterium]|nr:N-acetylneuraminate synthase family protein [Desulfobacterales bacterium]
TGMTSLGEIKDALEILISSGTRREKITLLHCATEYPTSLNNVNLCAMSAMKKAFPGTGIGYSDHTQGIEVSIAAVAMGATVIEKHFTIDRMLPGPDHASSVEPDELEAMVIAIRGIEKALGNGIKKPTDSEEKTKRIVRKSIVARTQIKKGETFAVENLTTKRPGTGISPMKWDEIIGSKANRDYDPDELI